MDGCEWWCPHRWVTCVLLALGLSLFLYPFRPAHANQIPREAYQYRADLIRNARFVWGLDAPVATMAGQVHQESAWRERAQSPYAAGLAQFTPATAEWISGVYRSELAGADPFSPVWALRALVRYDRHLWERVKVYDSGCDRFLFALSDYNGGPGWRIKRQKLSPSPGSFAVTGFINPGVRPANQHENQSYPQRIVFRHQPLYVAAGWGLGVCT
jgi:soluble lytic murein transglycosylase-like protein